VGVYGCCDGLGGCLGREIVSLVVYFGGELVRGGIA
jgi:hypothetical protein